MVAHWPTQKCYLVNRHLVRGRFCWCLMFGARTLGFAELPCQRTFLSLFPPNLNGKFVCLISTNVASKTHVGEGIQCGKSLFLAVYFLTVAREEEKLTMNRKTAACFTAPCPCSRHVGRACRILIQALQVLDCPLWIGNENLPKNKTDKSRHNLKVKCVSKEAFEVQVDFLNSWMKVLLFRTSDSSLTTFCSSLFNDQSAGSEGTNRFWSNSYHCLAALQCTSCLKTNISQKEERKKEDCTRKMKQT